MSRDERLLGSRNDSVDSSLNPRFNDQGKEASLFSSTINMVKNVVAAGLLSLPWAFRVSSTGLGMVMMFLVCSLSGYSFILLARCCELSKAFTYKDIGVSAFGPGIGWVIQVVMICYTFGSCVSFVVLVGDFIPPVFEEWGAGAVLCNRAWVILFASLIALLPLSMIKNLNPLKFTSVIGVICCIFATVVVATGAFQHGKIEESVKSFDLTKDVFRAVPIMTVSFAAHYNGPKFFEELRGNMSKFTKVIAYESVIAFLLYAITALGGYFHYGAAVEGNILKNYPGDDKLALVLRLAMAFSVIFTYPFAFHSFRKNVEQSFEKSAAPEPLLGRNTVDSAAWAVNQIQLEDLQTIPRPENPWKRAGLTLLLNAIAVGTGILLPEIEVVLAYKGALFGSFVIFIFPALFYLRLVRDNHFRKHRGFTPGDDDDQAFSVLAHSAADDIPPIALRDRIGAYSLLTFGIITGILGLVVTALKHAGVKW